MKHSSSVAFSVNSKVSFKVIIVGDLAVGKTSLVMRYIKDMFSKEYKVTVGFEFFSKVVKHGEEDVTVQIWDTVTDRGDAGRAGGVQVDDTVVLQECRMCDTGL
jgi:small GTP-binding protein